MSTGRSGTGWSRKLLMTRSWGCAHPGTGGRPASEPAGQVAERPPVLDAELPRPGRRVRLARLRRVPARQLLLPTPGIAGEGLASIALLGGHGRERSGSRHALEAHPPRIDENPRCGRERTADA